MLWQSVKLLAVRNPTPGCPICPIYYLNCNSERIPRDLSRSLSTCRDCRGLRSDGCAAHQRFIVMHISPTNDQELSHTQSHVFIQSHGMIPASQQMSRAQAPLRGRLVPRFKHVMFKTWASSVACGIYNLQKVA